MMFFKYIIIFFIFIYSNIVFTKDSYPWILTLQSCKKFINYCDSDFYSMNCQGYTFYTMGAISGMNLQSYYTNKYLEEKNKSKIWVGKDVTPKSFTNFLINFCKENPSRNIMDATQYIYDKLKYNADK